MAIYLSRAAAQLSLRGKLIFGSKTMTRISPAAACSFAAQHHTSCVFYFNHILYYCFCPQDRPGRVESPLTPFFLLTFVLRTG